ncbi:MAG: hypothetical protein HFJ43_04365 [Clostridia bacterium]|nr:hypothetical protein [Clostridia bacterium]
MIGVFGLIIFLFGLYLIFLNYIFLNYVSISIGMYKNMIICWILLLLVTAGITALGIFLVLIGI